MKKLVAMAVVCVMAASFAIAGEPGGGERGGGDRGRGGRGRGGGGDRGDRMRQMFERMRGGGGPGGMFGRGANSGVDVFDAARDYVELSEEQTTSVDGVEYDFDIELEDATAELRRQLNKKYVGLLLEIIQGEEKEKYKKIYAAMDERDQALTAAKKALIAVLEAVRVEQKVTERPRAGSVPRSKSDIIRTYINLTDEQKTNRDEIRRDGFEAMRDAMRDGERPEDWRNEEQRNKYFEATRKARAEIETLSTASMVKLLEGAQKPAYEKASTAFDAYEKKTAEIEAVYKAAMIALVGQEKFDAAQRRPRTFFGGGRPGGGGPPGGGRPGGGQPPNRTEF